MAVASPGGWKSRGGQGFWRSCLSTEGRGTCLVTVHANGQARALLKEVDCPSSSRGLCPGTKVTLGVRMGPRALTPPKPRKRCRTSRLKKQAWAGSARAWSRRWSMK
jgi:hypothetical protein